jgi:hypothetical protein
VSAEGPHRLDLQRVAPDGELAARHHPGQLHRLVYQFLEAVAQHIPDRLGHGPHPWAAEGSALADDE